MDRKIIVDYLISKYNNEDFSQDFTDDKNRIYSLDAFIYKEKGNSVKIYLEKEELFGKINNDEEEYENKDEEKMLDINTEDMSYKTYDHSVSSPTKSYSQAVEGNIGRSISVNIKKNMAI